MTAPCREPAMEKMPGQWLLARMGKRALRPGGLRLTHRQLADLSVSPDDGVVETIGEAIQHELSDEIHVGVKQPHNCQTSVTRLDSTALT